MVSNIIFIYNWNNFEFNYSYNFLNCSVICIAAAGLYRCVCETCGKIFVRIHQLLDSWNCEKQLSAHYIICIQTALSPVISSSSA